MLSATCGCLKPFSSAAKSELKSANELSQTVDMHEAIIFLTLLCYAQKVESLRLKRVFQLIYFNLRTGVHKIDCLIILYFDCNL